MEEETLSPGVELKSPARITEGVQLYFFETTSLKRANCVRRCSTCASLTSAHSGSLQKQSQRPYIFFIIKQTIDKSIEKSRNSFLDTTSIKMKN